MPAGQKLWRAEACLLQLAAEPTNTHTTCGKSRGMRQRLNRDHFTHTLQGERGSYKEKGRGGSQPHSETRTARQEMDGDVPLPLELKGCRHRAPRTGL